jgi:hypothetical protein
MARPPGCVAPARVESKAEQHQETRTAWTPAQIGSSGCGLEAQQLFACSRNTGALWLHHPGHSLQADSELRSGALHCNLPLQIARVHRQLAICTSRCIHRILMA